ncbi:MAG: hypothetical protein ACRDRJ_00785 [Streptosporangiaceae bacterium]
MRRDGELGFPSNQKGGSAMMYPRLMHPEPMQPGQAELMGTLHELHAVATRESLRAFSSEHQRNVPVNDMRAGQHAAANEKQEPMTDAETIHFEKVGDAISQNGVINVSGANSRYTRNAPRDAGGPGAEDNTPGSGTKGNRKSVLQAAGLTGARHRIATVLPGGQPDLPQQGYVVRGPYRKTANPDPGPVIAEDESWR